VDGSHCSIQMGGGGGGKMRTKLQQENQKERHHFGYIQLCRLEDNIELDLKNIV
jgi:hypothetical protein